MTPGKFLWFLLFNLSALSTTYGQSKGNTYQEVLNNAQRNGLPAIVALVKSSDGEVWRGKSGFSNIEDSTPLELDQSFRLASISKIFTTVVILQLLDEKRLKLSDTISKYLDVEIKNKIPNVDNITILQLLSHCSGIYSFSENNSFWKECFYNGGMSRVWSPKELISFIENKKPIHEPVIPFSNKFYSNSNYILLGMIIEKITSNLLSDEYEERIFNPLKINHTFLEGYDNKNPVDNYAVPNTFFLKSAKKKRGIKNVKGSEYINLSQEYKLFNSWAWAAGGISSNVNDLSVFLSSLRNGELLSNDSQKLLFRLNSSEDKGIIYFGGTGGSDGIQTTMLYLMPSDIEIIILINSSGNKKVDLGSVFKDLFEIAKNKKESTQN